MTRRILGLAAAATLSLLEDEVDPYEGLDLAPGATVTGSFTYQGTVSHEVPILDGTLEPYDQYLP